MSIAINKLILYIILLAVILAGIYIVITIFVPGGQSIALDTEIRICCDRYKAYGCGDPTQTFCNSKTINDLMEQAGYTLGQLREICGC